jgi:hypothetical protein
VLDEAVLHRPVGGRLVMREQFDHLVAAAELPNVTVQVLPFATGQHAGMDGTFTILLYGDWIGSQAAPVSVVDAGRLTGRVRRVVAAVV